MSAGYTTRGVEPRTIVAASKLRAGLRVIESASSLCVLADEKTRGHFVSLHALNAGESGAGAPIAEGGTVPALAAETVRAGDDAYTAPNGKFGKKSPGAIRMGRWTIGAIGGEPGQVELLGRMVTQ